MCDGAAPRGEGVHTGITAPGAARSGPAMWIITGLTRAKAIRAAASRAADPPVAPGAARAGAPPPIHAA